MQSFSTAIGRGARSAAMGLFMLGAVPAWAVTVTNPGLTATPVTNGVPSGWTALVASPDVNDASNAVGGFPGTSFAVTASASPDGGSWVGLGADDSFFERIGQSVSGFVIGTQYTVSWYAANFGAIGAFSEDYINPGRIQLRVDGSSFVGQGDLLPLQSGWVQQSLSFTATQTTHQLAFGTVQGQPAYIGIDGIAVTAVPEPASAALMLVGLLGAAGCARRLNKHRPTA